MTVLLMLFISCYCSLLGQPSVVITQIDDKIPGKIALPVAKEIGLSGYINIDTPSDSPYVLQLAWRRHGTETWWVNKPSDPFPVSNRITPWELSDEPVGNSFDHHKRLELMVLLMQKIKPFPEGITDLNAILLTSPFRSERHWVYRGSRHREQFLITPRIRIDRVDGHTVTPGSHPEVGLKPLLRGEVRQPSDGILRIVVQPLNLDQVWVLSEEPLVRNGEWQAPADLALSDYSHVTEFLVSAILSRNSLPLDEPVTMSRWRDIQVGSIMATSEQIRMTRIETPLAKDQSALKILAVNQQAVRTDLTLMVPSQSAIQGVVLGKKLPRNKAIWIMAADPFNKKPWQILGKAKLQNEKHWIYSPRELGSPGAFLQLTAVIGPDSRTAMQREQEDSKVSFAKVVNLQVSDEPPLEVQIQKIDRAMIRTVNAGKSFRVPRISAIEGLIAGRPLMGNEKIWILKLDDDHWQLLGQGAFRNRQSWAMPPIALGEAGEELELMAVISPSPVQSLNVNEQGDVLASSNRVKIRIAD